MSGELDPTGLGAHIPGAKLDAGKNRLGLVLGGFAGALEAVGRVGTFGAAKYSDGGWLHVPVARERYTDAFLRHIMRDLAGEQDDPETGLLHAAHAAWNALARLQLILNEETNHEQPSMPQVPEGETGERVLPGPTPEERLHLPGLLGENAPGVSAQETCKDPVEHLQQRITQWADQVFPDRTAIGALSKLMLEEIPELLNGGLDDPHEYADVLILVLDIASLRGIDAVQAAHEKMTINEQRTWARDPETGLLRHTNIGD